MVPTTKFKELLGEYGKALSDEEAETIRRDMYALAGIAFDFWEKDNVKNGGKGENML